MRKIWMTAVISHLSVKKSDEEEKMTETGRNYLSGSLFLSGVRDGNAAEKYTIRSVIGEGGSSVCYEAIRTKDNVTETGKLKEFYPVDAVIGKKEWYYSLERLSNGQLVPCAGTIRKFDEMCQEYLDTYRLLRKVIADNPQNEVLKSYIQYGEILYGCNEPVSYTHLTLPTKLEV